MRKMTVLSLTLISVLVMWFIQPAVAQVTGKGAGPDVLAQRRLHRWNAMAKWLQLTDEQKARIESILDNAREQARKIRDDASLTREQKRKQLLELRQNTRQEIGSVLTLEQREKLRKLWAWRWHRWQMWRAYRLGKMGKGVPMSPEQLRRWRAWSETAKRGWWWDRWGKPF